MPHLPSSLNGPPGKTFGSLLLNVHFWLWHLAFVTKGSQSLCMQPMDALLAVARSTVATTEVWFESLLNKAGRNTGRNKIKHVKIKFVSQWKG